MARRIRFAIIGLGLSSLPASAGVVDDYCKGFPQRYAYCLEREESAAVLALPKEARTVLFQEINAKRKAGLANGKVKPTPVRVCDTVKDYGRLPNTSDIWIIKCDNDSMYGVQFDRDVVLSGMSCAFLGSMLGSPCETAKWMRESDAEAAPAAAGDNVIPSPGGDKTTPKTDSQLR